MKVFKIVTKITVYMSVPFDLEKSLTLRPFCLKVPCYQPPAQTIIWVHPTLPSVPKQLAGPPPLLFPASVYYCKAPLLQDYISLLRSPWEIQTTVHPPIPSAPLPDTVHRLKDFPPISPHVADTFTVAEHSNLQKLGLPRINFTTRIGY